jgi:hypothetical protein
MKMMGFSKSLGFFREAGFDNPASRKVPAVTHQGVHQNQLKNPTTKLEINHLVYSAFRDGEKITS